MTNVDIRALAKLARLEVSDAEVAKLGAELPGILGFVEIIQKASVPDVGAPPSLRNVMRDDAAPHERGVYTEALLAGAPAQKDGRIAVKQVITRKRT